MFNIYGESSVSCVFTLEIFVLEEYFTFCSDDRSADLFRQKLEATTQMQAVLTPGCRPTCLIIDEIDGAPTVSVDVVMSMQHPTKLRTCTCTCVYFMMEGKRY